MKAKWFDLILMIGVLCFIAGAIAMFLGRIAVPLNYALPVLGMILIGAGASGRQRKDR